MQNTPQALNLANHNNKLNCRGFLVINFPPVNPIDRNTIYKVINGPESFFVNIVLVIPVTFIEIGDWYTLPATGLTECDWSRQWMEKHPETQPNTKLAVYCYTRI